MHQKTVIGLSCLLIAAAVGPVVADDAADERREQYELMKLFVESLQQIESNYVTEVDRRELVDAAIQGMIRHLDQYSNYIPPEQIARFNQGVEQEFGGIGVHVDTRGQLLQVMSPLPGSPAEKAGMRSGDVILEVDGKSLDTISPQEAIRMIQGPAGRPVRLKILHAGAGDEPIEVSVERAVIRIPTVYGVRLADDDTWDCMYSEEEKIGYVHLSHFSRMSAEELRSAVQKLVDRGLKGLVLDLRSNPGGLLDVAIEICDMFLSEGNIVSVRGRNVADREWNASADSTFPDFPIAILVNRYSASASEVVSAALQDNDRAIIVGERTWGKGSVQNIIGLEGGDSQLKLTMASYHRPSGINIHRLKGAAEEDDWGVRPDEGFEIQFSPEEFRLWWQARQRREIFRDKPADGAASVFQDTQLMAAVEYVRKQLTEQ